MDDFIIKRYLSNCNISDIKKFACKYDIILSDEEASNVYYYIKNNCDKYFNNNITIDDVIKDSYCILSIANYNKLYDIYLKYKENT